jgi:hypothetical protein
VRYANRQSDVEVLDELICLFRARAPIPDEVEFPEVKPYLECYDFPKHILTDKCLDDTLSEGRIRAIRLSLSGRWAPSENDTIVSYSAPWYSPECIRPESVDMVFSQAVLEHVDELSDTYRLLCCWLKPGGFMSHQIDFRAHGTSRQWNGHWRYSDRLWGLVKAVWPYLLNRAPYSTHVRLLREAGFEIVMQALVRKPSALRTEQLASRFRTLSDDDLTTSGAFIQAIRSR